MKIEKGKMDENFLTYITGFKDGIYAIQIEQIKDNLREYQKQYFSLVQNVALYTGYEKQDIHEMYKQEIGKSTTELKTNDDWLEYLEGFRLYSITKIGVIP